LDGADAYRKELYSCQAFFPKIASCLPDEIVNQQSCSMTGGLKIKNTARDRPMAGDDEDPAAGRQGNKSRPHVKLGNNKIGLPRSRMVRIALGSILIFGGILGFLPVLGFWMIPLGLLVLSQDLPMVRRWRRRLAVKFGRKVKNGDKSGS